MITNRWLQVPFIGALSLLAVGCSDRSEATKAAFEEARIAVAEGEELEAIERRLKGNPSIASASDSKGNTLLHHVAGGHPATRLENQTAKLVELLVRYGADMEAENLEHEHPLHLAAADGDMECIRALLNHGADVNAYQNMSRTPLHYVVDAFMFSVEAGHTLLAKGADANAKDRDGYRPIHLAIDKGNIELVKLLIAKGADVNAATHGPSNAETPLHRILGHLAEPEVEDCRIRMVEILLAAGADVNACDAVGRSPLYYAAELGNKDAAVLVRLLLNEGAEVNSPAKSSDPLFAYMDSPLHTAAENGSCGVVELLLAKGALIEARGINQETPLHRAAQNGREDVARLLLSRGANTEALDDALGQTALHIAAARGSFGLVRQMLARHANLNARDKSGNTPLHLAAENGSLLAARVLVAAGADVNAANNKGETPANLARKSGFTRLAAELQAPRPVAPATQAAPRRQPRKKH